MKLMYEAFDEVPFNWAPIVKGWEDAFRKATEYFAEAAKVMKFWFPIVSEAHRAEVKRVHSAYRAKQGRRKKRR